MIIYPSMVRGARRQTIFVRLLAIAGTPMLGVLPTDIIMSVMRKRGPRTPFVLVPITNVNVFTLRGWAEVDAVACPGLYRLDLPNAIFVNDGLSETVVVGLVSPLIQPVYLTIPLTDIDPSATSVNEG